MHNIESLSPQQQLTLTTDTQTQQIEYNQLADCYEDLGRKLAQFKADINYKSESSKAGTSLHVNVANEPSGEKRETRISLRDLQLLPFQHREFKIKGGGGADW